MSLAVSHRGMKLMVPAPVTAAFGGGADVAVLEAGAVAAAGVAVGADGLMVEVHNHPELALSDGAQALTPSEYAQLIKEVRAIHKLTASAASQLSKQNQAY